MDPPVWCDGDESTDVGDVIWDVRAVVAEVVGLGSKSKVWD